MTRSRWTALVLLATAFLLGVLAGAGTVAWAGRPDRPPERQRDRKLGYVHHLTKELALTAAQQDSVRAVLDQYRPAMDSLWRATQPKFETLRRTIRSEIRSQLTPDQQRKYDEMLQRHERRRGEARDRRP